MINTLLFISLSFIYSNSYAFELFSITLKSNQNAMFYLDGVNVGVGKTVIVDIDPKSAYTIIAKPEGYNGKEEYIEPPYFPNTTYDFYFMIGDKEQ